MYDGKMVFSQVMAMLPWRRFQTYVQWYQGDKKIKKLSCREFFLVMAFAQITDREHSRFVAFHGGVKCEELRHFVGCSVSAPPTLRL